jgi:hypothetical protein
VLQESRTTASAAVPPTPHKIFSRSPCIHRVSLECHTKGEYAQKENSLATHFFGKEKMFSRAESYVSGASVRFKWTARYVLADFPENFLKTRLNCE